MEYDPRQDSLEDLIDPSNMFEFECGLSLPDLNADVDFDGTMTHILENLEVTDSEEFIEGVRNVLEKFGGYLTEHDIQPLENHFNLNVIV